MTKRLLFFPLLFLPAFLYAQSTFSDPKLARIIEKDCDGAVFTEVQELPSLKVSKETFADTLAAALRSKAFPLTNGEVVYKFVVTTQSQFLDLKIDSGHIPKQKILKETVSQYAALWAPGKQSGRPVCAYVRLKINFTNDKVTVAILQ